MGKQHAYFSKGVTCLRPTAVCRGYCALLPPGPAGACGEAVAGEPVRPRASGQRRRALTVSTGAATKGASSGTGGAPWGEDLPGTCAT